MARQQQPRPAEERPPPGHIFRREERQLPFAFDASEAELQDVFHAQVESARIDEGEGEVGAQGQLDRQDDFQIIGRVQGIAMMRLVAGPEGHVAVPTQEGVDIAKEDIERVGLEDGFVTELVKAVDQEGVERAVQIHKRQRDQPVRPVDGDPGDATAAEKQRQKSQGLR